jgi:translocation and assembly module TamB
LGLLALAVLGIALVPWWLGTPQGTRWLAAQASRILNPASLEIAESSWSWFGPTRFRGFVLRDAQGKPIVDASVALWDRSLTQALFGRPALGLLRMPGGRLDIERLPDGRINLAEALAPILGGGPQSSLAIEIQDGSLTLHSPELAAPIQLRDLQLALDRPAAPQPTRFSIEGIEAPAEHPQPGALSLEGHLTRSGDPAGETLSFRCQLAEWPLAVRTTDGAEQLQTRLDGSLSANGRPGQWISSGQLIGEQTQWGTARLGSTVSLGRVETTWDLAQAGPHWNARQLILRTASAYLEITGSLPPRTGSATVIQGDADLAALMRQLPDLSLSGLTLEAGRATWNASLEPLGESGLRCRAAADLSGLTVLRGDAVASLEAPLRLDLQAAQTPDGFALDRFQLTGPSVDIEGQGHLDGGITLAGRAELTQLRSSLAPLFPANTPATLGDAQFTASYKRAEADRFLARLDATVTGLARVVHPDPGAADPAAGPVPAPPAPGLGAAGPAPDAPTQPPGSTSLVLAAEMAGPVSPPGTPAGLDTLNATLAGGGLEGLARIRPADSGRVVIERIELGPAGTPEAPRPAPWLAASGEFTDQTLILRPDSESAAPLMLDAEGLRLTGLGTDAWRASAALRFDLDGQFGPIQAQGSLRLSATPVPAGPVRIDGQLEAPTLLILNDSAGDTELGPAHAQWEGSLASSAGLWSLQLDRLAFESDALGISAHGSITDLMASRSLDLAGTIDPRWPRLSAQLAQSLGSEVELRGEPARFRIAGPLDATTGDLSLTINAAHTYGMLVQDAPIRVWWSQGRWGLDPIEATLNGGSLRLVPEIVTADEGRLFLRLTEGTSIHNAAVNEELSHRVLAYVAPVLDRTSRISGSVSASIREAVIPLEPDPRDEVVLEGEVVFEDVAFAPGPLMMQVYQALRMTPRTLRLDQPVQVSIRDGLIHERGFSLPLGDVARIEMAGTVGFDRSLALLGRVGMASEQFGDVPVFNQIAPALRLDFPIEGTLDDPRIDAEGLARSFGRMSLDSLKGLGLGSLDALVDLINRPPPTPEELAARAAERERARAERALRQQRQREEQLRKREERRLKREQRRERRMGS